jgi:hypothetical protein
LSSSNSAEVRFTVNVTVAGREAWSKACAERPYIGQRPSANTSAGVGWGERIGLLMPGGNDQWWAISGDAPTEPVAGEVIAAIDEFVLPAMQKRM